jgi:hypothetical protein
MAVKVPPLAVVGFLASMAALAIWLIVSERRFRAARVERFTRDAVQRGWRFSTSYTRGERERIDRWEGVGLSGGWTAESIEIRLRHSRDPRVLRWWNAAPGAPAPSGPVLALLDTAGEAMPDVSKMEGRLAEFAQAAAGKLFARAFERHFGAALPLDGRELHRVDDIGAVADGFVVFSDQPAEVARRLTAALFASSRQVCEIGAWAEIGVKRPWVAVCGDRIAVAGVSERQAEIAQVAALVDAGSSLARVRG